VNAKEVFDYIEKMPECKACELQPTLYLIWESYVFYGCDEHMIAIGDVLNETKYYRRYFNFKDFVSKRN
jgi:hypothetical protein